jgi:hypothetical protein
MPESYRYIVLLIKVAGVEFQCDGFSNKLDGMKSLAGQAIGHFTTNKIKFFMGRTRNYVALLQSVGLNILKLIAMSG